MKLASEPSHQPNDIHGSSGSQVLKMCPFLTNVTGTSQAHRPDPLRNGAFHPSTAHVERFELRGLRPLACLLEGQIVRLPTDRAGATRVTRSVCRQYAAWAGPTVFHREFDLDDLMLAVVNGRSPADTRMAFGAGGLLGLPIDVKLACLEAHLLLSLPFDSRACGANQIDPIVPAFCYAVTGHRHTLYRRYAGWAAGRAA